MKTQFFSSPCLFQVQHQACLDVDCQHEDAGPKEGDAGGADTVEEAEVQPDHDQDDHGDYNDDCDSEEGEDDSYMT